MKFWDKITGNDLTRQWKSLDARAGKLPKDFQQAYAQITAELWQRAGASGIDILAMLDGVLELFEDASASNRSALDVLGNDIKGFCSELAADAGGKSYRDRWRNRLNNTVLRKLGR